MARLAGRAIVAAEYGYERTSQPYSAATRGVEERKLIQERGVVKQSHCLLDLIRQGLTTGFSSGNPPVSVTNPPVCAPEPPGLSPPAGEVPAMWLHTSPSG